jgi:hypothetical protein
VEWQGPLTDLKYTLCLSCGCKDCQEPEDLDDEDDAPEEEIIGYECLGCGNVQETNNWGGRCDRCDGLSLEPMYN